MLDASVDERGLIFINGTRYAEKMSRMEVRDNAKNLMEDAYSAGGTFATSDDNKETVSGMPVIVDFLLCKDEPSKVIVQ